MFTCTVINYNYGRWSSWLRLVTRPCQRQPRSSLANPICSAGTAGVLSRLRVRHRSVFVSAPCALRYILKYVVRADRPSEIKVHRVQVGVAGCSGPRRDEDGWKGDPYIDNGVNPHYRCFYGRVCELCMYIICVCVCVEFNNILYAYVYSLKLPIKRPIGLLDRASGPRPTG
jgi:hypothetical protein